MHLEKKEPYVQPVLVKHEVLRDITAGGSGNHHSSSHYTNGQGLFKAFKFRD